MLRNNYNTVKYRYLEVMGLFLQVRITQNTNTFALRVVRTYKKSPHNNDLNRETFFD